MHPHDRLTILPNLHRAHALRVFRGLVDEYFERSELDEDGEPLDHEGARAARSQINQMLPRILLIVRAAGLGSQPGTPLARIELLQRMFRPGRAEAETQEILDILDMASGVYDGDRIFALGRTVSPFHYAGKLLGLVARAPRALLAAAGIGRRSQVAGLGPDDVARVEAAVARLADIETLIEMRFADLQDRQAGRNGEHQRQLAELAERVDFAERLLVRQRSVNQLEGPERPKVVTPV